MARRHRRSARHAAPAFSLPNYTLRHRSLHCEQLEDRRLLAVVTVDIETDLVDFTDGKTSLREAIFATNTVVGADEIRFDFGHDGPSTILLSQGELAITDAVSINGPGAGLLTIDGQLGTRLFSIGAGAGDVTFRGLTLTRGQTTGDNVSLADVINQTHSGGAIRSFSSGLLTLDQVDVVSNGTTGVYASGGALFVTGPLAITFSKVRGNIASGANSEGGGVAVIGAASITATTFSGNRAARGGGVSASGELTIDSSTLSGNRAVGGPIALGGAVYALGSLHVVNSTISTNAAQAVAAAQGAGIWTSGAATIAHSTIVANTASTSALGGVGSGGGLYGDQSAGETLTISHTIIAGNFTTEENGEVRFGGRTLDLRYSLIADNDGTNLCEAPVGWADVNSNLIGGPHYGYLDPLLDGLEENGGPTRTHALLSGSPAVFAGEPALVPGVGTTPEFDQRGASYLRRVGTRMAIGAVESSVTPIIVDSLADESDGDFGTGDLTLREAIELANAQSGFNVIEFARELFSNGRKSIVLIDGELKIAGETIIYGPGADLLTIDASGNDPTPEVDRGDGSRGFNVTANAMLQGMRVSHADSFQGGGIESTQELTLIDVNVTENFSWLGGGGVKAVHLFAVASQFTKNESMNGTGAVSISGNLAMDRCVVSENHARSSRITSVSGGIGFRDGFSSGSYQYSAYIVNSVIASNTSVAGVAGIRIGGGKFFIDGCLIAENSGRTGSGVYVYDSSGGEIANSTIILNSGAAGIVLANLSGLPYVIRDSTISSNLHGGISTQRNLKLLRSTVVNNQAGGGIVARGWLTLDHTIVAGNDGPIGPDILKIEGAKIEATFSLVGDQRGTSLVESEAGGQDPGGNRIGGPIHGAVDPLLAPLADGGGHALPDGSRLLIHALLPGSPAIDAGDPTLVPGEGVTPEFDQRGAPYSRLAGQRVDIGAIERQEVGTALSADFNFDGVVDGSDFLAWQRGFGAAPGSFPAGDATDDGVVDGDDLGVWQDRFGDDGTAPAVAMTVAILADEAFAVEQPLAIRLNLADAALQSFSILSRLNRPVIDLRTLNGLESSRDLWSAPPKRSVERPSDQPDAVREETKSEVHRRGEREARESVSLESLDRSFTEGTRLDSELSKWKNGYTWRDEETGVSLRVTQHSLEPRGKS